MQVVCCSPQLLSHFLTSKVRLRTLVKAHNHSRQHFSAQHDMLQLMERTRGWPLIAPPRPDMCVPFLEGSLTKGDKKKKNFFARRVKESDGITWPNFSADPTGRGPTPGGARKGPSQPSTAAGLYSSRLLPLLPLSLMSFRPFSVFYFAQKAFLLSFALTTHSPPRSFVRFPRPLTAPRGRINKFARPGTRRPDFTA